MNRCATWALLPLLWVLAMALGQSAAADGPATSGALSGKTVYLCQWGGWAWDANFGTFRFTRGVVHDVVTDLYSHDVVGEWLADRLRRMGARVVVLGEEDILPERWVVDDALAAVEGALSELAPSSAGWGAIEPPFTSASELPFASGGSRLFEAEPVETGALTYAVPVTSAGHHAVYVSWEAAPDRAPDARWTVVDAAGATQYTVDQTQRGGRWVLLGRHTFEPGGPAEIRLSNASAFPGRRVSADAVRVGGGPGVLLRGSSTTGRPLQESTAQAHAQLSGAPDSVFDVFGGSSWTATTGRFAAWDREDGEDAAYVCLALEHATTQRGVVGYVYGNFGGTPETDFSGVPGSVELMDALREEVLAGLRAELDPAWPSLGRGTLLVSDLNPTYNGEMPGARIFPGFATSASDMALLADGHAADVVARGVAHGIARYFAERDALPLVLPPDAPAAVTARELPGGQIELDWDPPPSGGGSGDPATDYRVYTSPDGLAFDAGVDVAGPPFPVTGLAPGESVYFRVAAGNAGGLSPTSSVVGARRCAFDQPRILIVDGYSRVPAVHQLIPELNATVKRLWRRGSNDGRYVVRHARAIEGAGRCFASATDAAVTSGLAPLEEHGFVDWFTGVESRADVPFDAAARAALEGFVAGGGRLLVSGAEIAWSHGFHGSAAEQAFLAQVLHLSYAADDADTHDVAVPPGSPLEGSAPALFSFLDESRFGFAVDFPDVFTPESGSAAALEYAGGSGGTAAIAWGGGIGSDRGVVLGFPFETIASEPYRAALMDSILDHLGATSMVSVPSMGGAARVGLVILLLAAGLGAGSGFRSRG